ncbi:MAG: lipopolysaccharide biosynthesis protein [Acidimicrobiales bacterium]
MATPTIADADAQGRSRRNPLPEGTLAVGVGLVVNGVTAYVFLALSARVLGPEAYAPLSVLWALVFLAGPGCFLPLEQEVSRALAERRAQGLGSGPVLRTAAMLGAGMAVVLVALTLAFSGPLLEHLFDDQPLLLAGFILALVGYCAGHLARGAYSGQGRFRPYAVYIGGEGIFRVAGCILFAVLGVASAGWYGVAVGVAPLAAVAVSVIGQRDVFRSTPPVEPREGLGAADGAVDPAPSPSGRSPVRELSGALAALFVGSLLAQGLVNAGPLAVELLGNESDDAEAGRFLAGLVIARVPLFLFQAVQAALLPKLSGLAGAGRFEEFRGGLRRLLVVTGALGASATVGAFALGPPVVQLMFGAEFELDHRTLGLLALSCGVYMFALALAQAVIALGGHRQVAVAWALSIVTFVLVTWLAADDLFLRVELGLVAGATVAAVTLAVALARRLAAGASVSRAGVVAALHDLPLEA